MFCRNNSCHYAPDALDFFNFCFPLAAPFSSFLVIMFLPVGLLFGFDSAFFCLGRR